MTHSNCLRRLFAISTCLLLMVGPLAAQKGFEAEPVNFAKRNLGGPRLGVTYIPESALLDELEANDLGPLLSQFGWHFEYQIAPDAGGPAFVVQLIPMVTGVEYGKLIPHGTLAMGIRLPNGFEFGLGPNLLVTPDSLHTSLVMGIGKTFNYSGVNLPINLVFATNPDGARLSFVFGYSIDRISKSRRPSGR